MSGKRMERCVDLMRAYIAAEREQPDRKVWWSLAALAAGLGMTRYEAEDALTYLQMQREITFTIDAADRVHIRY